VGQKDSDTFLPNEIPRFVEPFRTRKTCRRLRRASSPYLICLDQDLDWEEIASRRPLIRSSEPGGKHRSSNPLLFAKIPPPAAISDSAQIPTPGGNCFFSWVRLANPWTVAAENIHDSKRDVPGWA
jgi:hypothetical protein